MKNSFLHIGLPSNFSGAIIVGVTSKVNPSVFDLQPPQPTQFLTQQETAWFLQVDIRTVRKYSRLGVLNAYRFGHRVFYKRHELIPILISMNF